MTHKPFVRQWTHIAWSPLLFSRHGITGPSKVAQEKAMCKLWLSSQLQLIPDCSFSAMWSLSFWKSKILWEADRYFLYYRIFHVEDSCVSWLSQILRLRTSALTPCSEKPTNQAFQRRQGKGIHKLIYQGEKTKHKPKWLRPQAHMY